VRLWVDTDIGGNPDDAIALLCAAADPDVELVGVSTVDGDVRRRAAEARRLVPDVEVVAGPPPASQVAAADALLLIGPWTHGAALGRSNALPARVAAMGGTLRPVFHRGALRVVEHNVGRDPGAAQALLRDNDRITVVPLDVSATMLCTGEEEDAMVAAQPLLALMLERWRADVGDVPLCLHDPLALFALLGDSHGGIEREHYRVSVAPSGVMQSRGRVHDVIVAADRDTVVARVVALLGGTPTARV
jgi:inosine-uridine nucleoside N-ribohydrolase